MSCIRVSLGGPEWPFLWSEPHTWSDELANTEGGHWDAEKPQVVQVSGILFEAQNSEKIKSRTFLKKLIRAYKYNNLRLKEHNIYFHNIVNELFQ